MLDNSIISAIIFTYFKRFFTTTIGHDTINLNAVLDSIIIVLLIMITFHAVFVMIILIIFSVSILTYIMDLLSVNTASAKYAVQMIFLIICILVII